MEKAIKKAPSFCIKVLPAMSATDPSITKVASSRIASTRVIVEIGKAESPGARNAITPKFNISVYLEFGM